MRIKYILVIDDEKHLCKTLKDMSDLTNLHISSLYRLIKGVTKFKNKNSKKLENIKVYSLTPQDYKLLEEDQEYINHIVSNM